MSRPNVHGLPQYLRKDVNGVFFIDYYFEREGGFRKRKRVHLGKITVTKAKEILARYMPLINQNKPLVAEKPRIHFGMAAEAFLTHSRSRKKTFHRDEEIIRNLGMFFGDKTVENLTLDDVDKYVLFRRQQRREMGKGLTEATLNREIACLKAMINRMVFNGLLERNPIGRYRLFKEIPRSRTLDPEEYQRLLSECSPHLKPIVHLAYVVGMRRGELLKLRRDQVDYQNKVIVLEAADTKTQEKREIPLDDEIIGMLRRVPQALGSPYVFSYKGKAVGDIKTAFNRACARAGIKDFHFHDLRHCAVTNMRKAGVPDNVIMSITGHKTTAMFRRYDKVDRVDRQNGLALLKKYDSNKTVAVSSIQSA